MRAMHAGVARYDREELSAAMRAGKMRAAEEGRWSGGEVPYGVRLEAVRAAGRAKPVKRLVPDEETLAAYGRLNARGDGGDCEAGRAARGRETTRGRSQGCGRDLQVLAAGYIRN